MTHPLNKSPCSARCCRSWLDQVFRCNTAVIDLNSAELCCLSPLALAPIHWLPSFVLVMSSIMFHSSLSRFGAGLHDGKVIEKRLEGGKQKLATQLFHRNFVLLWWVGGNRRGLWRSFASATPKKMWWWEIHRFLFYTCKPQQRLKQRYSCWAETEKYLLEQVFRFRT